MKLIIEVTEDYYEWLKEKADINKAGVSDITILDGKPFVEPIEIDVSKIDRDQLIKMMRDAKPTVISSESARGHWLPFNYDDEVIENVRDTVWDEVYAPRFKCSECGFDNFASTYCPHCGALMEDMEDEAYE